MGVWAVPNVDFAVGGDITYTSPETPGVNVEDVSYLIFEYDDTNMTAQIVDCYQTDIPVPETMEIPDIIKNNEKLYTITGIGEWAFDICPEITLVIIPDSVTYIGDSAFLMCTSLTSITIGSGVTSIGESAFRGCKSLATINIKATTPPTGGVEMFDQCPLTTGIFVPSASVSAYRKARIWTNYFNKIYEGSF